MYSVDPNDVKEKFKVCVKNVCGKVNSNKCLKC